MNDNADKSPAEEQEAPIVDVNELNQNLPAEYAAQKIQEEEAADEDQGKVGGTGSVYSVPVSSYAAFKKAVLGRGYDIDNWYGWQCWDGAALLWQQLGLSLITGNGLAIGCWDLKRNVNKYSKFDLVTSVGNLKLGDVVVMRPNHIGFFDGFDGNYMRILGQNQGGAKGPNGGMAFNVSRINKSAFAGAFRLKAWHKAAAPKLSGKTYKVVKSIKGYVNSADAKARKNAKVTVKAGTYQIFNEAAGMVNVTTKAGVPGSWINPGDNKASSSSSKQYVTVKSGWGLSNVAQAAGYKDAGSATRWAAIAKLNGSSNWKTFNSQLKPGQKVRVK